MIPVLRYIHFYRRMNPYYSNWNYGYTLAPSSEQSRGAYETYDTNSSQIKTEPGSVAPEKKKFVSASQSVKTESGSQPPAIGPVKPEELEQPNKNLDPLAAIAQVHDLCVANQLVERYEKVEDAVGGDPNRTQFVVKLFIGAEVYEGKGESIKSARQMAALMCLQNTKYPTAKEKKMSMFKTANRMGMTPTGELHELAAKKNIQVDFKFLEPFNFEFNSSMRLWSKHEMLGNYRVQLNVAGYEFYGQAELPQQAKHNAATQALPVLRTLKTNKCEGKVVAKPGKTAEELETESADSSAAVKPGGKNVISLLNEAAVGNSITPEWTLISESGPPHAKVFTWELKMGEFITNGSGPNKRSARQGAADQMWATLPDDWKKKAVRQFKGNGGGRNNWGRHAAGNKRASGGSWVGPPPEKKKTPTQTGGGGDHIEITSNNPVSSLFEFASKKRIGGPVFNVVNETVIGQIAHCTSRTNRGVPFKKMEYTLACEFDGSVYRSTGTNKKAAKTGAAMEAWDAVKQKYNL